MSFWITFILIICAVLGFKIYIIRGVFQAANSKIFRNSYTIISIASLLIGMPTVLHSFSNGMIHISSLRNFIMALMVAVLICELLLFLFFLMDDIMALFKKSNTKTNRKALASSNTSRRHFIKTLGLGITAIPFTSFLYGITKGKYNFKIHHQELVFDDLPKAFHNFKIVQFSDLHSGSFDSFEAVKTGFDLIQEQQADLILFTGDLVNDLEQEIVPYKSLLKNLNAPFGKYSVLGNHDYPQDKGLFKTEASGALNLQKIKQHHADCNFHLLNNTNVSIEKDAESIRLIGVENWGNGFIKEGDLDKAIQGCKANEFSILMSHDPTHWKQKVLTHKKHIHLTLSGHTHGMQLGIEALGIKWSPIQYIYEHWAGLYKQLGQYLYVNRGFGFIAFAGRVGIPPEITLFTLKTKKT